MPRGLITSLAAALAAFAGGCQTTNAPTPAVLTTSDAETMAALTATLATAMERMDIALGPGDVTQSSAITVLPRRPSPRDTHSLAMPTRFTLMTQNGRCFVVREASGDMFEVAGVACRAVYSN